MLDGAWDGDQSFEVLKRGQTKSSNPLVVTEVVPASRWWCGKKESHGSHGNFYEGEQEQCCSVPVGALYGGQRVSQWHKLCWSRAGVSLAGTTDQPRQSRSFEAFSIKIISHSFYAGTTQDCATALLVVGPSPQGVSQLRYRLH